jgi:predicted RNA polymerase sigma factor
LAVDFSPCRSTKEWKGNMRDMRVCGADADSESVLAKEFRVALHRAVAIAKVTGLHEGLAEIDRAALQSDLGRHLLPAARAELLWLVGRPRAAAAVLLRAAAMTENAVARQLLRRRSAELVYSRWRHTAECRAC